MFVFRCGCVLLRFCDVYLRMLVTGNKSRGQQKVPGDNALGNYCFKFRIIKKVNPSPPQSPRAALCNRNTQAQSSKRARGWRRTADNCFARFVRTLWLVRTARANLWLASHGPFESRVGGKGLPLRVCGGPVRIGARGSELGRAPPPPSLHRNRTTHPTTIRQEQK